MCSTALLWSVRQAKKKFYQINVEGTENILKAAVEAGVKKFIHLSSVAVYGLNPPDGADENTAFQPCGNLYCDTKIASEEIVWAYHRDREPAGRGNTAHQCLWPSFQAVDASAD